MDTQETTANVQQIVQTVSNTGLEQVLIAAGILIGGFILVKIIMQFANKKMVGLRKVNPTVFTLARATIKIILYFLVIMSAASVLGFSITSFVALFSIIGLAISLSVQGMLSSFAGGIILILSKPFTEGDFIETDNVSGTVAEINLLQTKLDTTDGKRVYLPNSMLYTTRVINYNHNGKRRVELTISASYDDEPEKVRAVIMKAIGKIKEVLHDPAPEVFISAYNESDIAYTVWMWVKSSDYLTAQHELNWMFYGAFKDGGVTMTYPHLNVWMQGGKQE